MKRLALLCLLAVPGWAAADDGTEWYVAPAVGGISPDYHRDLKDHDFDYNFALGKGLNPLKLISGMATTNAARIGDGIGRSHYSPVAHSLDVLGVFNHAAL